MNNTRPFWLPDTQGFLAVAIIALIATIALILLTHPPQIDERTSGVLMTLIGVLVACLKDVYSFFFGSSKGSEKKDDAMIAGTLLPPTAGGTGGTPPTPSTSSTVTTTVPADGTATVTSEVKP